MGSCRAAPIFAVLAGFVCSAGTAHSATTSGVRLLYQRSAAALDCPDEPTLREAVTAQLGYDPFGDGPLTVTAIIEHVDGGLVARIELSDAEGAPMGARSLRGHDCAELAPAVELVLGLAVEPLRGRAQVAAKAEKTDPWTGALPEHATAADAAAVDVPPPSKPWSHWPVGIDASVGIAAALDAGPTPAFAFTVHLGINRKRWSLGVEMRGDLPASAPSAFGGRVETALIIGMLVPCVRHKLASVCALAALGAERGDGGGYNDPRAVSSFYAAFGGRLAVDVPLPAPMAIRVNADLLAPVTRMELYAGSLGDLGHRLYRTAPVSSSLGAAVLAHFP
jgi:hypothetical protein